MVDRQERNADLSSLIRDSLKSFNKLKCSMDGIGREIRPFFERNTLFDQIHSMDVGCSTVLKYHNTKSNSYYGINSDVDYHLDTFKHQNERYLEELIDHLKKPTEQNCKKPINSYDTNMNLERYLNNQHSELVKLTEVITGNPILQPKITREIKGADPCLISSYQNKLHNFTDRDEGDDDSWARFKSDFVNKYSNHFLINVVASPSKNRTRKYIGHGGRSFKDDFSEQLNLSNTSSSIKRSQLSINVKNVHGILFKHEKKIVDNTSLGIGIMEYLYIEQIVSFNNLNRSKKSDIIIIDLQGNEIIPKDTLSDYNRVHDTTKNASTIPPLALFIAYNFEGYINNELFIDNWFLLGKQLAMIRQLSTQDAVKLNDSEEFGSYIIEASWEHICLKEKLRMINSTRNKYSMEDTVDMVYNYHCNKNVYDRNNHNIKENILWKCIFSCIRCGDMKAAAYFAENLQLENVVFSQYIHAFSNNDLKTLEELHDAMTELYTFEDDSKLSFKRLIFSLLLNQDDIDTDAYFQDLNDLIWYKICKVHYFKRGKLCHIQNEIDKIITNHKNRKSQIDPLTICQALLYVGNYRACINYLVDFIPLLPHMVNLAIAMYIEGVISLEEFCDYNVSADKAQLRISPHELETIIIQYIEDIAVINVDLAVEYIHLLKDVNTDLVVKLMINISLRTSAISRLFGNVLPDGSHTECLVNGFDQRLADRILKRVAWVYQRNNDLYNAIRIYDISKNYKKVVKLINILLCETICRSSTDTKKDRIFETSNFIFNRMIEHNWVVDSEQRVLFEFLHDYLWLDNLLKENEITAALEVMSDCRFIPTNSDSIYDFQKLIKTLPPIVFRFLGKFIIIVATLFYHQYIATVNPSQNFCFKNQDSSYIKERMKDLVMMVTQMCDDSMIPNDAMQAVLMIDNKIKF